MVELVFFTIHTGAPLAVMRDDKPCLSPPRPRDLLCYVEVNGKEYLFIPVCMVICTKSSTSTRASFIDGSFIPNGALPTNNAIRVEETRGYVDTTKVTVSLLTQLPLTLAVFSDKKGEYVNIVMTEE
jgi:hypothetical protein